ncbi:hypothetical protein J5U23_01434 [Saccharolobus shibatae B12]|uniref:Glycosyl transferase family 1 domain-containing protein n=1 Tax=Saccharolobus shibatae (strain ATCC 51178 / DSM 5389 / JCM 8931 / NBRC 15437 / B12) TaxID=523848 RepID=A0A8F5BNI8_SACSH|nr:glycosyltransferase [Saccharolobus shibatae]QXJ28565.1 hypothetical protein J5U23_01434 [Saccharolobus shibatae B12]
MHINANIPSTIDKMNLALRALRKSIYCENSLSFDAYCIAKICGKKLVTTMQTDIRSYIDGIRIFYNGLKYHFESPLYALKITFTNFNIVKINKIVEDPIIKYLLMITPEMRYLNLNSSKVKILKIGNAFNPEILKFRTNNKEDYLVFWARLYSLKGILEIPYIMKEIVRIYDVKLKLSGQFWSNIEKERFFELIKKLRLEKSIEYMGFLPEEEKYKLVSKAKALVYPTHSDLFPIVILESLALGTPIISYDLVGPRSIYNGLEAVKFIKEFDVKGMAREILKLISMKDEDYFNLIYNKKLDKFLEMHSSWDKVAEGNISILI